MYVRTILTNLTGGGGGNDILEWLFFNIKSLNWDSGSDF